MTVTALQSTFNYNQWLEYFNAILPQEAQLTSNDIVIVGAKSFFEKLGALIDKTPKRVLANYVMWRQAVSSVSYLPSRFRQRQQVYNQATTGKTVEDPRWLECVAMTLNYYPHAFGALYVRKHFKEDAKKIALDMVNNIKSEFKEILKEIDWMDPETKKGANEKANTISEQIGFADELMNDAKIAEYYATWPADVEEDKYYESVFRLNVASTYRNNKRLREAIDKKEWTSQVTPAIVNAFYSSLENSIKFPAGILQGAFFNAKRPQYMNYGGIGFVIGEKTKF
jgi:neprilysin